jgi:phosphoribosylformylglycinamidine synthase subunit PurQ / glutaminase
MKFGVVVFPGAYCDHDCFHAIGKVVGQDVAFVWHEETSLRGLDAIVLPGGFSYGDYLRPGAIARFSPVMGAVREFAGRGGLVIGICNGFQMLTEAGLLPGALLPNVGMKYICRFLHIRTETTATPFTSTLAAGEILHIPIGHGDGNYVASEETLAELEDSDRIVFRYVDRSGRASRESNPNGSLMNIAGIVNEGRNVLGMMPHPERADEPVLGSRDGIRIFESMVAALSAA